MFFRVVALGLGLVAGLPSVVLAQDWVGVRPVYQAPASVVGISVSDPWNPLTTPFLRVGFDATLDAHPPQLVDADGDTDPVTDRIGMGLGGVAVLAMPLFENLAVGGRGAFHDAFYFDGYSLDGSDGAQRTWDFAALVELRLPTSKTCAFYLNGFGGLSVNDWMPANGENETGTGLHAGGAVGIDVYFGRYVGMYFEWGFVHRRVTHDFGHEETLVTTQATMTMGLIGRL